MRMVSRKAIPTETCYDLSVEKNHNFFANGVCVHNTNAGIALNLHTGEMWHQSRENIITLEKDNAGFAMFATVRKDYFLELFKRAYDIARLQKKYIVIFGEFFGGSIQKGVAITGLPKAFSVFDIMMVDEEGERTYLSRHLIEHVMESRTDGVVCVYDFPMWELDIDFETPELTQNKLVELTLAVEAECPVGKAFGLYNSNVKKVPFKNLNGTLVFDDEIDIPPIVRKFLNDEKLKFSPGREYFLSLED